MVAWQRWAMVWACTVGVGALAALSCQKEEEHPPRLDIDCEVVQCTSIPPAVGFQRPDGGGAPRDAGGEAGPGVVEGSVWGYRNEALLAVDLITDPVTVAFEAPTGTVTVTSTAGAYSAAGLPTTGVLWVRAAPVAGTTWLPTIETVEPGLGVVDLVLMPTDVMDALLAYASVSTPRQSGAGQVLVQFADASGGATGVSIDAHGGALVLYQIGDGWSDQIPETDASGFACIVNVPAASALTTFSFTGRSGPSTTTVRVVPDGVTVVGVPIE